MGLVAQPVVDAAIGQQFGDEAARHDRALVDVERNALQPRLTRQIRGRLARADALLDQLLHQGFLLGRDRVAIDAVRFVLGEQAVDGQTHLPQHEPRGLVIGVGGAVTKGHAGVFQLLGSAANQIAHILQLAHALPPSMFSSSMVRR